MSNGDAEAHLPDTIELSLAEVRDVLKALDDAEAIAVAGTALHRNARHAIRLITHKLWPDLGHLLDEDEE